MGRWAHFIHSPSIKTIDPRIPTTPGRSTSGFQKPGRHCVHQARGAVKCSVSHRGGDCTMGGEGGEGIVPWGGGGGGRTHLLLALVI